MTDIFDKYLSPSEIKPQEELDKTIIKTETKFGNIKKDTSIEKNKNSNVKLFDENNKPIFNISQSLIKQFTKKKYDGDVEIIERCPYYIYTCYIAKSYNTIATDSMFKGLYFEQLCLGSSARDDYKDFKPTKKGIDYTRIEEQATEFKRLCIQYGIEITPDNTQNRYAKLYKHDFEDECTIYITGVTDFEHQMYLPNTKDLIDCVIDLKLTKNITSRYGNFCWGAPEYIDHLQLDMYHYLTGKHGLYWVFDYSPNKANDIFEHTSEQEDIDRLHYRINKTIIELLYDNNMNYPTNGVYNVCKMCPHNPQNGGICKEACNIKPIPKL